MGHPGLTMEKQKQTNLLILVVLFYLWHIETHFENKPKNPIYNESTYDLLKLKSALSRKSHYLFIYPLFTLLHNKLSFLPVSITNSKNPNHRTSI